ncbi:hypothetical protein P691DRAFT_796183 [Macrolepiota fuliginosa MF-IS2]|uniref:Mitochondrial outer membrane transport complex Sam37/metaxin N-terminal domain-containing protein n=1 Tax=Macrolepiota fuliginosa MF-IS2 TaxID=1400762 RepID=A0A9P6CB25_9AGAR|nr:hypothetical protein P691DRAFT_796183 [Macrolepiota fuliginosa MF-IS2]
MVLQTEPSFTLHVWPGQWGLPSFDPTCLATVLYLQFTVPGEFSISECTNPDISPSGQLPLLVHDKFTISSLPSIIKYISGLKKSGDYDLDVSLTPSERSQKIAWTAHIESHFGNLVYYTYYSCISNWEKVIHPVLVGMYSVPQRYYVPGRIRASYKPRLESDGLWGQLQPEHEKKHPKKNKGVDSVKQDAKQAFTQAIEKEKIQDKAKEILGIYARLLEGKEFIYKGRPTTLDLILAAHTLLLVTPPFPDTTIKELAVEWYTTLDDHAKRIQSIAFGSDKSTFPVHSSRNSIWDLIPSRRVIKATRAEDSDQNPEDAEYEKLTLGFIGLAIGSVVTYFALMGSPIRVVVRRLDQDDGEEEDEGEEEEEEEAIEEVAQFGEFMDEE